MGFAVLGRRFYTDIPGVRLVIPGPARRYCMAQQLFNNEREPRKVTPFLKEMTYGDLLGKDQDQF